MQYIIDKNYGYIRQKDFKREEQSVEYWAEYYEKLGEKSRNMSWLRNGMINGVIKGFHSLMDIGIGNGDFLKTFSNSKMKLFACDFSDKYVPQGVKFIPLDLMDLISVDVITMFDSIEHFETPEIVNDFKCKYLVISTPNCYFNKPTDFGFMNWKHRKPNEHCCLFNRETLKSMLYNYAEICYGNIEDAIRVNTNPILDNKRSYNIITCIFKKKG